MSRRAVFGAAAFVAAITMSGMAQADDIRARVGQQRPNAWGQQFAPPRPAAINTSSVVQDGRGHAASVVQAGNGNTAGIRQFGRDNTAAITQVGDNNIACLIQAGRNLDGAIRQVGDNQSAGVLQTRWGSSDIPPEMCATAPTRADLMAYAPRPIEDHRPGGRGRGRGAP